VGVVVARVTAVAVAMDVAALGVTAVIVTAVIVIGVAAATVLMALVIVPMRFAGVFRSGSMGSMPGMIACAHVRGLNWLVGFLHDGSRE